MRALDSHAHKKSQLGLRLPTALQVLQDLRPMPHSLTFERESSTGVAPRWQTGSSSWSYKSSLGVVFYKRSGVILPRTQGCAFFAWLSIRDPCRSCRPLGGRETDDVDDDTLERHTDTHHPEWAYTSLEATSPLPVGITLGKSADSQPAKSSQPRITLRARPKASQGRSMT